MIKQGLYKINKHEKKSLNCKERENKERKP